MSWLDLIILLIFGILFYFSTKRGIIVEFFDILCLLGALCIGSFAKGPMSRFFMKQFQWTEPMAHWVSFLIVAIPVIMVIFLIGSHINDTFKVKLPPELVPWGGGFFGFFKSFLIAWMALTLIGSIPGVSPDTKLNLGKGFAVRIIDSATPAIETIISIITPEDASKQYNKSIELSRYPKTKEEADKQYKYYLKYIKQEKPEKDKKKRNKVSL